MTLNLSISIREEGPDMPMHAITNPEKSKIGAAAQRTSLVSS